LAGEKMQIVFKLKDAEAALEPLRLETQLLKRENQHMRQQQEQLWSEVESATKEKHAAAAALLAAQRKLEAEADASRAHVEAASRRAAAAQEEGAQLRERLMALQVELQTRSDSWEIERQSLMQKLHLKQELVEVVEQVMENASGIENDCMRLRQKLADAEGRVADLVFEKDVANKKLAELIDERENRLKGLVNVVDDGSTGGATAAGTGAVQSEVLRKLASKQKWSLSELVDEVSQAKRSAAESLVAKQAAEDRLEAVVAEAEQQASFCRDRLIDAERAENELLALRGACAQL
jgi:hypothetical protein